MNNVILMGRLTKDAEVRQNADKTIARFTLAVDRRGDGADFINCVSFGKTADFFERFGRKGTKFVVEGRIQTGSYTNKDGQKVFTTDVVVESAEFAESKNYANTQPAPSPSGTDFMAITEDELEELPFN